MTAPAFKIGNGYDVHAFATGRKLVLGGVTIDFERGLEGHSDADVLVHAVCDAVLGAAGMGDIGDHFPDTDQRYKNISSMRLLEHCRLLIREKGLGISNMDCTVFAQVPKISPYKEQMAQNIARVLETDAALINIKATTTEKLGFIGREQGIAAQCTALLTSIQEE